MGGKGPLSYQNFKTSDTTLRRAQFVADHRRQTVIHDPKLLGYGFSSSRGPVAAEMKSNSSFRRLGLTGT